MNGVCVMWRGWIDLERLDGVGCLEYDEKRAAEEDALLRDQLERYNQRVRDFDEKQRAYRSGATQPPHLNHHHHHHHHHHGHHSHHVAGSGSGTSGTIEPHLTHRQDPEMEVRLRAYWGSEKVTNETTWLLFDFRLLPDRPRVNRRLVGEMRDERSLGRNVANGLTRVRKVFTFFGV